ncbi:MAG: hypothetical protein A3D24_00210 [Candidatus Blackburnbacteria bacterium RIFCSPHIGHO2_02_FULL_39_13]|uniref:SHS2 domain-containing protein n=1 Tax=Candidatus Blackburnbacteria bacterium RIFCSPLOWO2_01_FULL_40_20 TaxID=1797519 RepID=A0A1G1VF14_9BACT|nr:MAG: hypothetical protein A2694_02300 [Candidatus Blackburnbacteria bacterium RIFCSPHIGHO2_01_FULL_40_17]OGY09442.1 MAG: hypothetical protein A3D24_00210 [Candidatus Blackburnbacteria bacterium RIFCSPHIGHO2_02_FULL_39_13]OGY14020.1 MAG: hypothetical protein A3A77_03425 [Candidatus Blackburnbacteria bacterium RIFCSPLOWO2_01_FULL_40_20]OGY15712.1 MAG: hypothetical protein A3I52_01460 [Candidatus Blackburnbacteria bacterium RIFCSPLOWO2_02_FULL_40_10]
MSAFGLDIGSQTIKAIQLEKQGENFVILAAGITPAPPGGLISGNEKSINSVSTAIKKLISDSKIQAKQVNISLSESLVFTRLIQLPLLTDEEVASAISWQAEPYIPIPISEAVIDYQVVARKDPGTNDPGKTEVLLVAAPKTLVETYIKTVNLAGLDVTSVETELISLSRSIAPVDQTILLVDLGTSSTDLAIVKKGQLVLSRSIPTGGDVITRAVSSGLSLSLNQAEEYKKAYGLRGDQLEGKVKSVIEPAFRLVIDEMKKIIQYYKNEVDKDDQVGLVVVSGGGASMSDVTTALSQNLGLEIIIGDPFAKVIKDEQANKALTTWAPYYGIAVGLAQI